METEKSLTIRLTAKVEKRTVYPLGGRKHAVYDSKIGVIEATGNTQAESVTEVQARAVAFLDGYGTPVILWSLDGREAWIAFCTPTGWGYAINDAARSHNGRAGSMIFPNGGAWSTREECLEHMRAHWYDLNARNIVDGIVALCTDRRQWVCQKCQTVQRSHAPYKCKNPACGADAHVFDW